MSDEQTALSWLAIAGLIIGVWLVYRTTLSAIIFGVATPGPGPITILPGAGSGIVGSTPGTSDVPPNYGITGGNAPGTGLNTPGYDVGGVPVA